MSSIKFTAKLPEEIQPGDKVRIKGILFDDAQQFSINFVNDSCEEPTRKPNNITYHFKWILDENVIVENYKENGSWIDHRENKYDALDEHLGNRYREAIGRVQWERDEMHTFPFSPETITQRMPLAFIRNFCDASNGQNKDRRAIIN